MGRILALPIWAHLLAMVAVASLAIALTGPGVAFFSDEGAVVVQTRMLSGEGTWVIDPPAAAFDPEGAARPFQNGDLGTKGLAPYAKHPLYPVLLASLTGGSPIGAVIASLAGLAGAAVMASLLATRIAPVSRGLPRATLWVVGLASPLLFAAGLVVAHTLAAAVAGLVAWVAVTAVVTDSRRSHLKVGLAAGVVAIGCVIVGALRTEALFLGPSLALGVMLVSSPSTRWSSRIVVGFAAVGGSAAAVLLDSAWSRSIIGERLRGPTDNPVPSTGTWVLDRLHGLYTTWVQAGYSLSRGQEVTLWLAVVFLVGGAVAWRCRWIPTRAALWVGAVGVSAYVARLLTGPTGTIPGVLIAFPLVALALALVDVRVLRERAAAVLLATSSACIALVVLTQYPNGGGLEWGWRYASFLVPLALPPLLWGVWLTVRQRPDARSLLVPAMLLGGLVAILPSVIGLRAQAQAHTDVRQLSASIADVALEAQSDGDRAVVLSWNRFLPQILYQDFDRYDWVVPSGDELVTYAERLGAAGVEKVILAGPDASGAVTALEQRGWESLVTRSDSPYDVVVLSRSASNGRS